MSDLDPAAVGLSTPPLMPEQFSPESDAPQPAAKKSEREGLPPGYRMRADAHYVEHLTSRRSERSPAADPLRAAEAADRPDGGDRAEKLLAQLAEDLGTIEAAAAALSGETSRMSRRVNADLLKSQIWRASWALKGHALLGGSLRPQIRPRPLAFLLGQIRTGWAAECRLTGITFHVHASDWNAVVAVDEASVVAGVNGAIVATLGLIGQTDGAVLTLSATAGSGGLREVDVVQEEVLVVPTAGGRFFDASWSERPGGWLAGLGASTARAAAQLHGGDALFLTDEQQGSTLRLQFTT